tara:strand:- start:136 stop:291 length:156 start_codon:yes stop_codon:yes gene_type:complete
MDDKYSGLSLKQRDHLGIKYLSPSGKPSKKIKLDTTSKKKPSKQAGNKAEK